MQTALGPADGAIQLKGLALLAGRKLLLADDSATIQKVIDLTFADEGVRVLAVSNGREAIDQLLDFAPDIVLADVHMPSPNGYEVCEYVKTHELLKNIPVVLLVGSFEPFDEMEARRVGADDILTKPFSSIRRLIDRVGALVSSPPAEKPSEKEAATAELPKAEEPAEEPQLSTQQLEVTTANTLPLPGNTLVDTLPRVEQPVVSESSEASVTPSARLEAMLSETHASKSEGTSEHEGRMEPGIPETKSETQAESSDVLLDLGELEHARGVASDDFVLDLDDAQEAAPAYEASPAWVPEPAYESKPSYEPTPAYEPTPMRAFVEPEVKEAVAAAGTYDSSYETSSYQDVETLEPESPALPPELTPDPVPVFGATEFPVADTSQPRTPIATDQLSPEMIDAIARRAVELMSDKVIREIAWEVVPDLAELLIKRQLEEKSAQ